MGFGGIIDQSLNPRVMTNMDPTTLDVTVFALFIEFGSILGQFVSLVSYLPLLFAKQGELFFPRVPWKGFEDLGKFRYVMNTQTRFVNSSVLTGVLERVLDLTSPQLQWSWAPLSSL